MNKMQRQLVLNKGHEKFIFRYDDGREDELLDALIDQAKSKRTSFDWFDAAVLSFKGASSAPECIAFYNQWFSARQWAAPAGWIGRGSARQVRFTPQKADARGAVDIRFDRDGSGLVVVTP